MRTIDNPFSFGIEEEYYLVDRRSRALITEPPRRLIGALKKVLGERFSEEYMRSQVEIATPVCTSSEEARDSLVGLRRLVGTVTDDFGLAPIAAATHPFSRWRQQRHRNRARYNGIAEDFQAVGRRMVICGLHVHVGIADNDQRIAVMNAMRPYLPLLLALSTSSPFWGGERTGLKSYRTAITDATPRKGLPEPFADWQDYERAVGVLTRSGIIDDASKIWWDIRPSSRYPTLEVRIMDVCPLVDDALCLAAFVRCIARSICRTQSTAATAASPTLVVNENRWRAQRYGIEQGLIDSAAERIVPIADLVERLLADLAEDAEALDCVGELEHARTILSRGTSADRQLGTFDMLVDEGSTPSRAIIGVVDQLIEETLPDSWQLPPPAWLQRGADGALAE